MGVPTESVTTAWNRVFCPGSDSSASRARNDALAEAADGLWPVWATGYGVFGV